MADTASHMPFLSGSGLLLEKSGENISLHKQIADRNAQILYRGTDIKSYGDAAGAGRRDAP